MSKGLMCLVTMSGDGSFGMAVRAILRDPVNGAGDARAFSGVRESVSDSTAVENRVSKRLMVISFARKGLMQTGKRQLGGDC